MHGTLVSVCRVSQRPALARLPASLEPSVAAPDTYLELPEVYTRGGLLRGLRQDSGKQHAHVTGQWAWRRSEAC